MSFNKPVEHLIRADKIRQIEQHPLAGNAATGLLYILFSAGRTVNCLPIAGLHYSIRHLLHQAVIIKGDESFRMQTKGQ